MQGGNVDWIGVGQRLLRIRKESQLSQREFGRRFGVSQNMISLYEKGRSRGSVEFYIQVAQFGGRTIEWLLVGCEDRTTETLREMIELHDKMNVSLGSVRQMLDREAAQAAEDRFLAIDDSEALLETLEQESDLPQCLRAYVENPNAWRELALTGREVWAIRALARLFGDWDERAPAPAPDTAAHGPRGVASLRARNRPAASRKWGG